MPPDGKLKGINVVWYYDGDTLAQLAEKAAALCTYAKLLGANALAFNIPIYMDSRTGNAVYAGEHTPNPQQVDTVIAVAKRFGFRVTLRPLIDEQSFDGHGRNTIEPTDRAQWFSSYASLLLQYLVNSVRAFDQFDISVELNTLADDPLWQGLISEARLVYDGALGWCSNWDIFAQGNIGPEGLDVYGVDFYPPVELDDEVSVSDITSALHSWLAYATGAGFDVHSVVLSEVGIAAQAGAYRHPADWGDPEKPLAPLIQARWFGAVWSVVSNLDLPGMFAWMLDLNHPMPGWDDTVWSRLPLLIFHSDYALAWCYGGRLARKLSGCGNTV